MLVALCSDKGSPGTTTTALALASAWPTPAVVVEADLSGGDISLRVHTEDGRLLAETPTVLTLAAAARSTSGEEMFERFSHRVNEQLTVVPGPLLAEQAAGAADWRSLGDRLAEGSRPVLLDVGRLHTGSTLLPVAAAADVVVLVARADTESMIRMRERAARLVLGLAAHRESPPRLFPVLIGLHRHGVGDVADLRALLEGTPAGPLTVGVGHVAHDVGGVQRLLSGQHPSGRLARTTLMRSARRTCMALAAVSVAQSEAVG